MEYIKIKIIRNFEYEVCMIYRQSMAVSKKSMSMSPD